MRTAAANGRFSADAQPLADRELEGLVGWMLHRN
jgi:hypothetical protein